MVPGKYNILCPQGSTFNLTMTYYVDEESVDLTSYYARMQVRESHASENIIVELTTDNDLINLYDDGRIELRLSDHVTAGFIAKEYVYDLELGENGNVHRIIEGKFLVSPEVTR
jgi:hypothetical protein